MLRRAPRKMCASFSATMVIRIEFRLHGRQPRRSQERKFGPYGQRIDFTCSASKREQTAYDLTGPSSSPAQFPELDLYLRSASTASRKCRLFRVLQLTFRKRA